MYVIVDNEKERVGVERNIVSTDKKQEECIVDVEFFPFQDPGVLERIRVSTKNSRYGIYCACDCEEGAIDACKEYLKMVSNPVKEIKVINNAVLMKVRENGKLINRLYDNEEIVAEWE